jgi:hypothetical protein
MDIYTLKALAKKEGISYDHARYLAIKFSKREIETWRGYCFFGPGRKYWLAYDASETVVFHNGGESETPSQPQPESPTRGLKHHLGS